MRDSAVVNDVKMAELFRTFWPNRPLDSKWYDNYEACTLASPQFSSAITGLYSVLDPA